MSFVTTQPEGLSTAARNLAAIGSALPVQNAAASAPTTGVVPAAADVVSALVAAQFATHAQRVSTQARAIHDTLVNMQSVGARSHETTEAINAAASS